MIEYNVENELVVTGDEVQVIVQGFDKDGGTIITEQVMIARKVQATPKVGFGAIRVTDVENKNGKMVNITNRKEVVFLVDGVEEARLNKTYLGASFS